MEEFLRPNLKSFFFKSRIDPGKSAEKEFPLSISIKKLTPVCKRTPLCEIEYAQTADEKVYLSRPRNKILVERNQTNLDESPSLLVSDEYVREYLKAPKLKIKLKKPAELNPRSSKLNQTTNRKKNEHRSSNDDLGFLKRKLSETGCKSAVKRMFDYRDIFSIANRKIKLRNKS